MENAILLSNAAPDAHALLSSSSAKRWLNCTPSARLEAELPDVGSKYASEGSHAHAWAEVNIRHYLVKMSSKDKKAELDALRKDPNHSKELEIYVEQYVSLVLKHIREAHRKSGQKPTVLLERRVEYDRWVPEGFGTSDCIILYGSTMEVFDLKYGRGVAVSAIENPQMRLYALGAYDTYALLYPVETVTTTICQPRIDGGTTSETLSLQDLLNWGDIYVAPRAELAFKGEGERMPGDHCKFCKLEATCFAKAEQALALARENFALADAGDLTTEEIATVLEKGDALCDWIKKVQEHALKQALAGTVYPGFKVVEGVSRRKISDEVKAYQLLQENGFCFDEVATVKLKGLTDLEKAIGKKRLPEILGELLVKPKGKPTLVPQSDKRPAIPDQLKLEFTEEM